MMPRRGVVVFTPDVVGERMAGPGIRAYHFARELARRFPTTLIAQLESFDPSAEPFTALERNTAESFRALREASVVIGQPTREILALDSRRQRLVFDLFDPVVLELNELYGSRPAFRQRIHLRREWGRLHAALRTGSLLIAAAPRQRDFYAGVYAMVDGAGGSWEERWIEVPFGIEPQEPEPARQLPESPPIIVWNGGTWEWLDPETAVAAVAEVNRRGVACRLLLLGAGRPNIDLRRVGSTDRLREVIDRAKDYVVSNPGWVPYRQRAGWLRSAKIAIMLHRRTLEAQFSIRTRLFDAIWCSLPVVASQGGFAADLVQREGLGVVVRPSDVDSAAGGIERLLRDDEFFSRSVSNLRRIQERYMWSEVTRPLVEALEPWVG